MAQTSLGVLPLWWWETSSVSGSQVLTGHPLWEMSAVKGVETSPWGGPLSVCGHGVSLPVGSLDSLESRLPTSELSCQQLGLTASERRGPIKWKSFGSCGMEGVP